MKMYFVKVYGTQAKPIDELMRKVAEKFGLKFVRKDKMFNYNTKPPAIVGNYFWYTANDDTVVTSDELKQVVRDYNFSFAELSIFVYEMRPEASFFLDDLVGDGDEKDE